jgi:excinuclease ABC subunit A
MEPKIKKKEKRTSTLAKLQSRVDQKNATNDIALRGARQNNLQGFDLNIPLGKLTVICGVSGSGKTSLALDTLYAEGQRRYIESFSAYSRQFLQRIDKPRFTSLTNLPPSIAVTRDQRGRNNRSTVGTASEMLEYLRIAFAKHATLTCHRCQRTIVAHTPKTVAESLQDFPPCRGMIAFEIAWQAKSELSEQLFDLQIQGFIRLAVGGKTLHLADDSRELLARTFEATGNALVIIDRVQLGRGDSDRTDDRILQSLATAFEQLDSNGRSGAVVLSERSFANTSGSSESASPKSIVKDLFAIDSVDYQVHRFSAESRCEYCQISYPESEPRLFSFNSPIGACEACEGFGETVSIDRNKVIPDKSLSLRQGAIAVWRTPAYSHELEELIALAAEYELPLDVPVSKLKAKHWKIIDEGVPARSFGGLNGFFAWLERKKYKMHVRAFLARWRTYVKCQSCDGRRLSQNALSYRVEGRTFAELCDLTLDDLGRFIESIGQLKTSAHLLVSESSGVNVMMASESKSQYMSSEPLRQVRSRVEYLKDVGLGYLALARPMHTLSSGEAQRVMMTNLLGSSLVDMLYVFDEPTVGLHPQDTQKMSQAILGLRDRGNTIVLVEHEPYLMRLADRIVEIGPKAGEEGGRVVFDGTPDELMKQTTTTGRYLSGSVVRTRVARPTGDRWLELLGATSRNLKGVDLRIPIGCFTSIVGPSGSGKSSLLLDTLCPALQSHFGDQQMVPLAFAKLLGSQWINACLPIDQSPIQRSSRSCPATYSKAMDDIRQVFADIPEAKSHRLGAGHFSFNSELGRCPTCEGLGYTTVEMQFMADVQLLCTDCNGHRFQGDVLSIRYRDLSIAEVLGLSVAKAHAFFRGCGNVQTKLQPLLDLGLGYLPLGQSLASISAGESMRLKLASHLDTTASKTSNGTLFVMDEPTTGLHFSDVERLVDCIERLVDGGNTVVVIEHNQQLIDSADHVIELGPGAGPMGGQIVSK